ncbi:MAG: SPW repeat protein [Cytophagaceae bacterium]
MKFISTRTHGYMDYVIGALLIISPWLFGFSLGGAETWIPVAIGVMVLVMTMFTDHEVSVSRQLSMTAHLSIDVISGIFLALSPWIFGFNNLVYLPHLLVGIFMVGSGFFTYLVPENCPQGAPCYKDSRHRTTAL